MFRQFYVYGYNLRNSQVTNSDGMAQNSDGGAHTPLAPLSYALDNQHSKVLLLLKQITQLYTRAVY